MSKPRLLDLFCSAGGSSMGYSLAGFDVVGVDNRPQPHFPFTFVQADALEYVAAHGHEFSVISASPPCQAHTSLRTMHNAREHADLIPATRAALRATGKPYVIENVPGAPMPNRCIQLCGSSFGLGVEVYDGWRQLRRHRWFESNHMLLAPTCQHHGATIGIYGDHARDRRRKLGVRGRGIDFPDCDRIKLAGTALQIDWMNWRELSQAIPPAYCKFIGEQLMAAISQPEQPAPSPPSSGMQAEAAETREIVRDSARAECLRNPTYVLERPRKGASPQQFLAALRAHYPGATFHVSSAMAAELGPADDLATHRYAQNGEALVEKKR